jgi:hypothetical protein
LIGNGILGLPVEDILSSHEEFVRVIIIGRMNVLRIFWKHLTVNDKEFVFSKVHIQFDVLYFIHAKYSARI